MKKRTHLGMTKKGHEAANREVQRTLTRVLDVQRPRYGDCFEDLSRLLTAATYIGEARAHAGHGGASVLKLNEQVMSFRRACVAGRGVATFDGLAGKRRRSRRSR